MLIIFFSHNFSTINPEFCGNINFGMKPKSFGFNLFANVRAMDTENKNSLVTVQTALFHIHIFRSFFIRLPFYSRTGRTQDRFFFLQNLQHKSMNIKTRELRKKKCLSWNKTRFSRSHGLSIATEKWKKKQMYEQSIKSYAWIYLFISTYRDNNVFSLCM